MVRSTQKEIRQRAPLWLLVLLLLNFGLMSWDAKVAGTQQPVVKAWAQSAVSPLQRATTGVGGAGLGFFRGLWEMRNARDENQTLRQRLADEIPMLIEGSFHLGVFGTQGMEAAIPPVAVPDPVFFVGWR